MKRAWLRTFAALRPVAEFLAIVSACCVLVMWGMPYVAAGATPLQGALWGAMALGALVGPLVAWRASIYARSFYLRGSGAALPQADRGWAPHVCAFMVFAAGATLTLGFAWTLHHRIGLMAERRFDALVHRVTAWMQERADLHLEAMADLKSDTALVGRPLSATDLKTWSAGAQGKVYRIRAVALVRRVEDRDVPAFMREMHAQGATPVLRGPVQHGGVHYILRAIEPLRDNRPAWGLDLSAEPDRREAIERAIDTGEAALSAHVQLVQDEARREAFCYFLPIYTPGPTPRTVQERRARLQDVISAPIDAQELFTDVPEEVSRLLHYDLFDVAPGRALHRVAGTPAVRDIRRGAWHDSMFSAHRTARIGGRELLLTFNSTPAFEEEVGYPIAAWLALLGLMFSGMATFAAWQVLTGRERARRLAQRMTDDLQVAKKAAVTASRESAVLIQTLDQFSMVCVTAPEGHIIEVNDTFCSVSGYTREELVGQNPRLLNAGEHDPFFWLGVWQTLLHGHAWTGQVCNRKKSGDRYWAQCVIAPIMGGGGQVEKYISIAYDITEARRVQDELTANAERYNLAIDGGNDGLWDWMDLHSHEMWWSPQFFRLLGYEPGEIEADLVTFDAMLHPEDQEPTFAAMERAFREHAAFDVEYRMRGKSGEYRWFRSRAKVYFDDFGAATRMAGSIQDVHEHKEAQAEIKERGQQMAAIFSLSPDGFVSFNAQGCVSYVSPAFSHLTGLPCASLAGLDEASFSARLFERAVPHQPVSGLDAVKQLSETQEDSPGSGGGMQRRAVVEMKPPARRMLEMRLSRGQGGAVSQVLHLRDVTHETEVDQMKSAFLSMAAHELRTPMASIYGFTELLLTRELKPEKQKDLLGRIYRQSEAMASIINELLDLARIESRQGKDFSFDTVDLAQLVSDVIRDFKLPPNRQVPLSDGPADPVLVWVDRQKMQQAVLNVLSNAYKYSPQGGDVMLRFITREDGGKPQVGLQIEDHGIGLSPEQLARVGERFYRADKSGNIPGTGLGVTIVKEIMEVLGGSLSLASTQGEGTTVTLWLPRLEAVPWPQAVQVRDAAPQQAVTESAG